MTGAAPACNTWTEVTQSGGKSGRCSHDSGFEDTKNVPGPLGCQARCRANSKCTSFSFASSESDRCILYSEAKKAGSSHQDGSHNYVCFTKPSGFDPKLPPCGSKDTCNKGKWMQVTQSDGSRGRCKTSTFLSDSQKIDGSAGCRAKCGRNPKCKSFSFATSENNRCILFAETKAQKSSFQDGSNNFVCFNKPGGWDDTKRECSECKPWITVTRPSGEEGRCKAEEDLISVVSKVDGFEGCKEDCKKDPNCKSFSYSVLEKSRCILFAKAKKAGSSGKDGDWKWRCRNKPDGPLCGQKKQCKPWTAVKKSDGADGRCQGNNQISDKQNVMGVDKCKASCEADSKCKSFSFSKLEKNRCMLFSETKKAGSSFKDNNWQWVCLNKPSAPICVFGEKCNQWVEVKLSGGGSGRCKDGNQISDTKNVPGAAACRANCKANSKCKSFTFSQKESNRCILSSEAKTSAFKDHSWQWVCFNKPTEFDPTVPVCGSNPKNCNKWGEIKISDGNSGRCKDGNQISDTRNVPGAAACRANCKTNSKCKSFSFSQKESNRCILSSEAKTSAYKDNAWQWVCFNKPTNFNSAFPLCEAGGGAGDKKCNKWQAVRQSNGSEGRCKSETQISDTRNVAGTSACRANCKANSKCKSFSFSHKESNRCILFPQTKGAGTSFKDGSWEYVCFNKPADFDPSVSFCGDTQCVWPPVFQNDGKTQGRCHSSGGLKDTQNVPGPEACKATCQSDAKCQSFSFSSKEKNRCILFSNTKGKGTSFRDGSWDYSCFNKPAGGCKSSSVWLEIKQSNGKYGRCQGSGLFSDTRNVPGIPACKEKCKSSSKCQSFSFASSESNRCLLYSLQKTPGSSTQDGSHNFYCYNKPAAPLWVEVMQGNGKSGRCKSSASYSDTRNVAGVPSCQAKCSGESKCQSFSFASSESNRCILYSTQNVAGSSFQDGGHNFKCYNRPSKTWPEVKRYDGDTGRCQDGGAYSYKTSSGIGACQASCAGASKCKSFSFSASDSNRCILYSVKKTGKAYLSDGGLDFVCFNKPAYLEIKQSNGKSGRCQGANQISDNRNTPNCQAQCDGNNNCKSFSFASSESNRCILFSAKKANGSSFQDGSHNFKCFNKP